MRILIIGGGSIGKRHIKNLKLLGYEEICCFKRKEDYQFEKEFEVKVVHSIQASADFKPDVVFVCTPNNLHIDGINFGAVNNAHIFIEKPFVTDIEHYNKAKEILNDYKKVFFIGYMLRYHEQIVMIKKILNENIIGSVFSARFEFGSFLPNWHPNEDYKISYASQTKMGGGVLNTISHEIDLIYYFFGLPASIYAKKYNFSILDIDADEQCDAIFGYKDKSVSLHLDMLQKKYHRTISITGENGKLTWDWDQNKIIIEKYNSNEVCSYYPENEFNVNQLYIDELKDFFELINCNQTRHPLDMEYAFLNTRLLLKMHQSSKKK